MDLTQARKIHMIGIGGAGMCGLAEMLADKGYRVSGSDAAAGSVTAHLQERGLEIYHGHLAEQLADDVDMVVISSAIPADNQELQAARERGLMVIKRGTLLAQLFNQTKGIAVAGAHGKTTTTAMLYQILITAGLDPSFIVGGQLQDGDLNMHTGGGEYFVTEADESDASFLELYPLVSVVTNIENDHMDFYKNRENISQAFLQFINQTRPQGRAVLYGNDSSIKAMRADIKAPACFYGDDNACDYYMSDWQVYAGGSRFRVHHADMCLGELILPVPGRHNALNALAAAAAALFLDIDFAYIQKALRSFHGAKRRFQLKGSLAGVTVVDDYAHHPSEIQATLRAARETYTGRVIVIFQPHRYTRTQQLYQEFGQAFTDADEVIITGIYAASEQPIAGISGKTIADQVALSGKSVFYQEKPEEALLLLEQLVQPGDLVITMGAGDIWKIGNELLERLPALPRKKL